MIYRENKNEADEMSFDLMTVVLQRNFKTLHYRDDFLKPKVYLQKYIAKVYFALNLFGKIKHYLTIEIRGWFCKF